MEDDKRALFKDLFVKISVGLVAALFIWLIGKLAPSLTGPNLSTVEAVTTGLNLVVVLTFCLVSLKVPRLQFAGPFVEPEKNILNRANKLMKQLNVNILLYAFCLVFVYAIYFAAAAFSLDKEKFHVDEITNLFNFGSSIFIYLSFKVLYDRTLDDENEANLYYMDAAIFAVVGIGSYTFVTDADVMGANVDVGVIKKNFSLIIGILNSLAMGLLFARFISMENALMNIFEADNNSLPNRNQKMYIKNIMIFLLPFTIRNGDGFISICTVC
jgi:hypothetical protein